MLNTRQAAQHSLPVVAFQRQPCFGPKSCLSAVADPPKKGLFQIRVKNRVSGKSILHSCHTLPPSSFAGDQAPPVLAPFRFNDRVRRTYASLRQMQKLSHLGPCDRCLAYVPLFEAVLHPPFRCLCHAAAWSKAESAHSLSMYPAVTYRHIIVAVPMSQCLAVPPPGGWPGWRSGALPG